MGVRRTETALIVWSGRESTPVDTALTHAPAVLARSAAGSSHSQWNPDAFFDAGSQGCGDGPLDKIAAAMRKLQPGQTLEIHATDPSVAADLAAWCRMTGHQLVEQSVDRYLLRRT